MADRFILSHLRRQPLFARLLPEQLAIVADAVQPLRYEPGEIIFRQGQISEGLLLFVAGRGVITQSAPDGKEVTVGTVSANEYVNQAALFNEVTTTATLRIVETAIVLFLARQRLAAILAQYPDIQSRMQLARAPFPADPAQRVFKTQRQGEKVLASFRAHWWAFASRLWLPFVVAALLFILSALAGSNVPFLAGLLFVLGLTLPGLLALYIYAEWRNDKVVITDQRVTRVRRTIHTWATVISEIPISAIHEVNVSIPPTDPFAQMFDYGKVIIKTSGDTLNLVLDHVPHPKVVQNIIFTNRSRYQESIAQQNRDAMRNEMDTFLGRAPATPAVPATPSAPTAHPRIGFLQMRYVNEKGETVYRKHYLVWFGHVVLPLLVVMGGFVLFAVAAFGVTGSASGLGLAGFALAFLVTLFGAVTLFLADWDWRNDMYIVGDQTIALIHRRPLWLQNQNDQILLSQVDNVISETQGFVRSLINMGDVKLLLTGTEVQNAKVFKNVHRPQQIQQELSERRRMAQQQQAEGEARRQRQAILDYLSVYHDSLKEAADDANVSGQAAAPPTMPPTVPPPAAPPYDRSRPPGVPRIRPDDH